MENKLYLLLENVGDMALKRRARRIVEELSPKDKDSIIDVGCGDGFYLHILSKINKSISLTGVDFDRLALQSAKKNLRNKKITLVQVNLMEKIPFKDKTFDKAIMTEVAEHLPNDVKGIKEVYRILKNGGTLVLTVPNRNYPFLWDPPNWILERTLGKHIKSGFWAGIWNQHIRLYHRQDIINVVKKAGFTIEKVENVTHYSLPFNHHILNFAARMLYGGKVNQQVVEEISKFSSKPKKRSNLTEFAFRLFNFIDRFNENVTDKSSVSVFIKAKK